MSIILIIAIIWGASALARATKEAARQKEIDRQRREQAARSAELARMTAEWKQRQAEAKIETQRLIALEREQMRQAREQEKLAKEQEKQAAQLAKHEKRISDLEYRMEQAEADISHWNETVSALYALLDIEMAEQAGTLPGSKTDIKCQKKIITLNNQIHSAEARLAKAKHIKSMAERELSA